MKEALGKLTALNDELLLKYSLDSMSEFSKTFTERDIQTVDFLP